MHYIGVFGVKPWNSPKKIKVSIDGSPTKSQKTMGTLIFLVNYTKNTYLCIFFTWLWIQNEGKSISYQFCPNGFSKTLTALVCMSKKACHFLKVPKTPRLAGPQARLRSARRFGDFDYIPPIKFALFSNFSPPPEVGVKSLLVKIERRSWFEQVMPAAPSLNSDGSCFQNRVFKYLFR